jgi:hypothetical protein
MQGASFQKMTLRDYMAWLNAQPRNKYAVIKKYLQGDAKLQKLIAVSAIVDPVFHEKDPRKILQIIEKNKIPITNDTVTALNTHLKKRNFIFNKLTRQITFVQESSNFSMHDRTLEQKLLRSRTSPHTSGAR